MSTPTPAVAAAIKIMRLLQTSGRPLGVSEIARQMGLNKSTAHGIIATLVSESLLAEDGDSKRYQLGAALVELAQAVRGPLTLLARPYVDAVAREFGLGCFVAAAYSNRELLILDGSDMAGGIRVTVSIGDRFPLTGGALGKAYLAWQSTAFVLETIERVGLPKRTKTSVTKAADYLEQLAHTRKVGYGEAREEYQAGANAVAAPIFDSSGAVRLMLLTFGLPTQLPPAELKRKGKRLREVADTITALIGGVQQRWVG